MTPSKPRYPPSFFLAILSSTLLFASLNAPSTILPLFAVHVSGDESGWGVANALVAWMAMAFRLPTGALADRLGRRQIMFLGAVGVAATWVLLYLVPTYVGLLAQRALVGIGLAAFTTAYKALAVDLAPPDRRGEAIGLSNLTFSAALILASPLGERVAAAYGYGTTFLIAGGFALMAVLCLFPIREPVPHASTPTESFLKGARTALEFREVRVGAWGMLALAPPFMGLFGFLPLWAASRGIAQGVGLAFSAFALADVITQPLGGWLGDRLGRRQIIVPGMLVVVLGVLILLYPAGRWPMYVGAIVVAIGMALTRVNLDTLVQTCVPHHLRGTAAGLQYASFDVWNGVFSWSLGVFAASMGYSSIYLIAAVIAGVWVVLLWMAAPGRPTTLAEPAQIPATNPVGEH